MNCKFENNLAIYDKDKASFPVRLRLIISNNTIVSFSDL